MLGSELQKSLGDTNGDLLAGMIGSAAGGALLLLWVHHGWAVMRRTPAEAVERAWERRERRLRARPPGPSSA